MNPISEDDQYLFLAYNLSSSKIFILTLFESILHWNSFHITEEYNIWHFTNYIGEGAKFICEFPAPPANTTTSTEDMFSLTTESSTESTIGK